MRFKNQDPYGPRRGRHGVWIRLKGAGRGSAVEGSFTRSLDPGSGRDGLSPLRVRQAQGEDSLDVGCPVQACDMDMEWMFEVGY
jgi:hypothetical protein